MTKTVANTTKQKKFQTLHFFRAGIKSETCSKIKYGYLL